jgi:sugar-specific transcriptional regulator TrmB
MDDALIRRLQEVGLSLYEARLYIGLLRHGPQNGNELSRASGVPSSKVYSTLEKLMSQGIVHSIKRGSTNEFVCIAPTDLIARLRKQYNEPLDFLEDALPAADTFELAEAFLTIKGVAAIQSAAAAMIEAAADEIHISLWSKELANLRAPLDAGVTRGVAVFGMLYGAPDEEPPKGSWLRHHYQDIVMHRVGGRMLTLVTDAAEALVARIPTKGEPTAVRTGSSVLTLIVQEYLHHDLVLQRAQINIGFDEWDRWWQADPDLRTTILGRALRNGKTKPRAARTRATR